MNSAIIIIGGIGGVIMLFILLRELNCWYWKINKMIELTELQNKILARILQQMPIETPIKIKGSNNDTVINKDELYNNVLEHYESLSQQEKKEADKFINYGLKLGDKLTINKKNRQIYRFDEKEWDNILKNLEQNDWIIIAEK